MRSHFAPSKNIDALFIALSGFTLILLSLKGVGISADSITYTSVSRSMNATGAIRVFDGGELVDFPVGYPFFLALIQFVTRLDPFVFGLFLNSLLFGGIIYIIQCLLKQEGVPSLVRCLCGVCLVCSPALLEVYEMLWSETVFIFCVILFLAISIRYEQTHRMRGLLLMALVAAMAAVTRYAGLTLIATGAWAVLSDRAIPFSKRVIRTLLFGALSCSFLLANLIRNRVISGYLTGDRKKNYLPLSTHLHRFGEVLCSWLPLLHRFPLLYTATAVLFIVIMVALSAYLWVKHKESLTLFSLSAAFCVLYSWFILATALYTEYERLDVRLLSPLYIPAVIALLGGVTRGIRFGKPSQYFLKGMVIGGLGLLLSVNVVMDGNYLLHPDIAYKNYVRYDLKTLHSSATLRYVNDHPSIFEPGAGVYSNAPDLMYLLTTRPADYLPDLHSPSDLKDFQSDSGSYLIWINACLAYPTNYMPSLRKHTDLALFRSFSDGAIYIQR